MTKTEKLLTAITTAVTFETTVPGCNLLIAMRELLSRLQSNDWDYSGYLGGIVSCAVSNVARRDWI